jgi:hypothetical protein
MLKVKKGKKKNLIENEKTIREIDRIRANIRKKLSSLKSDFDQTEKVKKIFFKPITESLQKIVPPVAVKTENVVKRENNVKPEKYEVDSKSFDKNYVKMENVEQKASDTESDSEPSDLNSTIVENPKKLSPEDSEIAYVSDNELLTDDEEESNTTLVEDDEADGENLEDYFNKLDSESLQLDKTYGPKKINQTWYLGNKELEFDGKYLLIDDEKFKNSKGLIKLIFNSAPNDYTKEDLEKYRKILELTNVYRQDFDEDSQIKGTKAYKYLKIIKPLIADKTKKNQAKNEKKTQQGGNFVTKKPRLMELSESKSFVYYADPNFLVERLKLLISSERAGNNSHRNEINEIVRELRAQNIIY